MRKSQASVELLVIAAIGIIILVIILSQTQRQLGTTQSTLSYNLAQKSVNDLAKAADAAHLEGSGAKKKVSFQVPQEAISVSASGRSISMRLQLSEGQSDAVAQTSVDICAGSSLSSTPGTYTVFAQSSEEGCVLLGTAEGLTVSPSLLFVNLLTGNATQALQRNVTYSNTGSSSIDVTLVLGWADSAVNVSFNNIADSSFTLAAGSTRNVTFNITVLSSAIGSYGGNVTANASNGDAAITTILVEVSAPVCTAQACAPSSGQAGQSNVSAVAVIAFLNSTHNVEKQVFQIVDNSTIRGANWAVNSSITLDVRNSSNASLSGYPKLVPTNALGSFTDYFDPSGRNAGYYYVYANDSATITNTTMGIEACST